MVLKLQLASELPGIFLRHRWMAGPCPGVSDQAICTWNKFSGGADPAGPGPTL